MGPTLIGLLQESVVKFASLAALKHGNPEGGLKTITYAELYAAVKELGTGLITIGLAPGTHVAILSENNPRWLIVDLAILGSGGVDVPLGTGMTDRELEQVLAHADCEFAVVEDAASLHRLLSLRRRLPRLRRIVVFDFSGPKPHAGTGDERVLIYSWEEVLKKGRTRIARGDRQFDLRGVALAGGETATLVYTSGTTGRPKGVMLSHANIMHTVTSVGAAVNPEPGSAWLSVLPVWHSFERTVEYCSLSFGCTIVYSRPSVWKIFDDLLALSPEYLVTVPTLLEAMEKSLAKRLGFLQQLLVRFEKFYLVFSGFIMGRYPRFRREERVLEFFAAIPPLVLLSPLKLASHFLLRQPMRKLLGGNLKAIICGGGPLPAYLDHFFSAIGVDILEGYGLTEASPVVSLRSEKAPVLGTVGRPLPSTEVRIAGENGEALPPGRKGSVRVKGPQVMQGYYKDPAATRQILGVDGWLETGDNGMLTVDGNLVITGRAQHALKLRNGERVEPEPIEMALQESPCIQEAVLVGRESVGLLIVPNMDWLRRHAAARRIPFRDPTELLANPAIRRFYEEEVMAQLVNRGIRLPGGAVPRIALLPAVFEVGRELTRTMNKRREVIAQLYGGLVEKPTRA
ncbi:MAG TPA: AMP-binding protein [Spirochaetia bacterium]|nr:AMP-binding protein [Spirochaetia bacterium]